MNGAAMNCRQDPSHQPQLQDPSSLHNPGYHLQINSQQNLQPQNSKTLNYPSFSSNYPVEGYYDNYYHYQNIVDSRYPVREVEDPRYQRLTPVPNRNEPLDLPVPVREVEDPRYQRPMPVPKRSEPLDLPVPQFQIDEYSVSSICNADDDLIKGSKGLDLDTRIGLLIKSKALAGMHPIFSDLNESEESESDLEDPFLSRPRSKFRKESNTHVSIQEALDVPIRESFDDPEKPLSRPPSPFLSRATYLFWFNKAIEIKQQAKAQEQALLEQATKRLSQDNSTSLKTNQTNRPKKATIPKSLMDEISKELKEVIRQEFIREVIEQTAFNTLDDWWENQNQEKKDELGSVKVISSNSIDNKQGSCNTNSGYQGSTSPKMPFPWNDDVNPQNGLEEKHGLKPESKMFGKSHKEDTEEDYSGPKDIATLNSVSQETEELKSDEISFEDSKKTPEAYFNTVTSNLHEKTSFDRKDHSVCVDTETQISNPFEFEVLAEKCEASQSLSSDVDDLKGEKTPEKLVIVKDILDFLLNNVNKIIVRRNDNILCEKANENFLCQSRLMDSLPSENIKHISENIPHANL